MNSMTLFLSILISFLSVRGFRFKVTENGLELRNTQSFTWLLLLLAFTYVVYKSLQDKEKQLKLYAALFSLIVSIFYIAGISMEKMKGLGWIWSEGEVLLNVVNLFFSHFCLYYSAAYLGFKGLAKSRKHIASAESTQTFSCKRVIAYWVILTFIYLPWYLSNYPGIVTPDTADQINDAITLGGLRDHHSAFLTLMMRIIILPVRSLTGSLQTAVGVVTLLQMLIVTFVFAATLEWVGRYLRNRVFRIFVFLWYAFYPVYASYSVTLWKDILFSVCFLGLMLCLDSAAENEKNFFSSRWKKLLLLLTLAFLPLMRHNGTLISIITGSALLIHFRNYRKQTAVILGGVVLLFGLWRLVLIPVLNVTEISSSQGLSVLEQQMARAMSDHHDEITDEQMKHYTAYFDIEDLWTRYRPRISDPIKRHFRDDLFETDPIGFFRTWAGLGLRYPLSYIEAFLANNYGYWFPETHYWVISSGVEKLDWDIEDVHAAPILNISAITRISDYIREEQYLKTPLLPLLFSRGACWWLWLFCGFWCLYQNRKKFILFLPGLALWTGILISPVYNEYRYVYGLFVALPLVLASCLQSKPIKS